MSKQLSLWPTREGSSPPPDIWKTLEPQQQKQVITALANLINKTVCPHQKTQTGEVTHER